MFVLGVILKIFSKIKSGICHGPYQFFVFHKCRSSLINTQPLKNVCNNTIPIQKKIPQKKSTHNTPIISPMSTGCQTVVRPNVRVMSQSGEYNIYKADYPWSGPMSG